VYSFLVCYGLYYDAEDHIFQWWMPVFILASAILTSFARITLGVHYPSDCLFGFLQGLIICVIGTGFRHIDGLGCISCFDAKCYAPAQQKAIDPSNLGSHLNWIVLSVSAGAGLLLTVVSVVKPIEYWQKCDRVFGMILPAIVFQLTFLCPRTAGNALPAPLDPTSISVWANLLSAVIAIAFVGMMTGLAWVNNGRFPILSFVVLFVATFAGLAAWRLYIWTPESAYPSGCAAGATDCMLSLL
jgi:membrane-associated phospholipid phosphatase